MKITHGYPLISSISKFANTTLRYTCLIASFLDNFGKPVPEYETIITISILTIF